jgi:hypothetical protein
MHLVEAPSFGRRGTGAATYLTCAALTLGLAAHRALGYYASIGLALAAQCAIQVVHVRG